MRFNKRFYLSMFVDFSFLLVLYSFVYYIIQKIKGYTFLLQSFSSEFVDLERAIQENMSNLDYNSLLGNLEVANSVMQKISWMFLLVLIGSFVIYVVFQGFNWSFLLKNKFKKYIWRFGGISLFSFFISLILLWFILYNIRGIMINYFSGLSVLGFSLKAGILFILFIVLWYYTNVCYVLLGKNKVVESLRKSLKFRTLKSILVHFVSFISVLLIIVLFLILNLSGWFWLFVELVLILFVINYCKFYFVRIV